MSNDIQKPKSRRFCLFFRGDMWARLKRFQKQREKEVESRIWLSDVIHVALDRYLPPVDSKK